MWNIFHYSYKLNIWKENRGVLMYLPSANNLAVAEQNKQCCTQCAYCMWLFFLNWSLSSGSVTKIQNAVVRYALFKGHWLPSWEKNKQLRDWKISPNWKYWNTHSSLVKGHSDQTHFWALALLISAFGFQGCSSLPAVYFCKRLNPTHHSVSCLLVTTQKKNKNQSSSPF